MDRSKSPVVAFTVLVVVAGCVLAWSSGGMRWDGIWTLQSDLLNWASGVHLAVAAILLTGAVCFAQTRRMGILWLTVTLAVASGAVTLLLSSHGLVTGYTVPLTTEMLRMGNFLTRTSTALPLIVLLSLRLRGRLEWLRIGTLALMGGLFVSEGLAVFGVSVRWVYYTGVWGETVLLVGVIIMLAATAWGVAFRQMNPKRPPADAGRMMGFTCPRCGLAQEMALPAGECAGCRLRLYVDLEEGTCGKCGYALRGLTGDKCPECGTAIGAIVKT